MATILCLSSHVARGYVGGTASRAALERLGHETWLLPTVILSNHPGHPVFAGEQVPPGRLRAMIEALEANGWLGDIDAAILGYMPTSEHAALAARMIERITAAHPDARIVCDPILGDDLRGLYVDESAAAAIRDHLLPLAHLATPNRFELEWLAGESVDGAAQARAAAYGLGPAGVLATSVPDERPDHVANLLVAGESAWRTAVPARAGAPHGTGDVMTALYLGHCLNGVGEAEALGLATAGVEAALDAGGMADELHLAGTAKAGAAPAPWPVERLE